MTLVSENMHYWEKEARRMFMKNMAILSIPRAQFACILIHSWLFQFSTLPPWQTKEIGQTYAYFTKLFLQLQYTPTTYLKNVMVNLSGYCTLKINDVPKIRC